MPPNRAHSHEDPTVQAHDLLMTQLEQLTTSDHWLTMLDMTQRFHAYSARNVLLLIAQGAQGRVAGYRTWQTIPTHDGSHCQVRRGATGMLILAPVTRTITQTDEVTGERVSRRILNGFKAVRVFDEAALVDPPAIPDVKPELLGGQAPSRLFDALAAQVRDSGFSLTDGDCAPANGETNWVARQVVLREGLDDAQRTKTLAHELAHIRLHDPEQHPRDHHFSRARAEVEAESVAYLVCRQAGLNSADYTMPYVAHWSNGNLDLVADTAERAVTTARVITAELHRDLNLDPSISPDARPRVPGRTDEQIPDQLGIADPTQRQDSHLMNTNHAPEPDLVRRRVELDARAAIARLAIDPAGWGADPDDAATIKRLDGPHARALDRDPVSRARRNLANALHEPNAVDLEPPGRNLS
jgi:hypothetical protein